MAKSPNSKNSDIACDLSAAIDVFTRGFAFTRSFTHPCLAEREGPLWVVRDGPRKKAADYRNEEWIAYATAPAEVDTIARNHTRGRFAICHVRAVNEPDDEIRAAYKSLGYRLATTEPFMVHRMGRIPALPEPMPVERVVTQDLADRIAKASRKKQALPEHLLPDSPLRLYAALDGDAPIGWLKSIEVGNSTWVANVFVEPRHRRKGIGKSMLARMLRDDRAHGSKGSYLLASHTGALLYPNVGYELIGELLLYTPKRR
jgi:GNAT superfamily N-acetyltransferase